MSAHHLGRTVLAYALVTWALAPIASAQGHGHGHGRPATTGEGARADEPGARASDAADGEHGRSHAASADAPAPGNGTVSTTGTVASGETHQALETQRHAGNPTVSTQSGTRPSASHVAQGHANGGEGPPFRPKGWDEGKKVGWEHCAEPPGLAKKTGCNAHGSLGASAPHGGGAHGDHGATAPSKGAGEKPAQGADHKGKGQDGTSGTGHGPNSH
jgi:hypothetical protein